MPRFAANLTMLFSDLPFLARFQAAFEAGFSGIEFLFPYDHPVAQIKTSLDDCGLPLVLFNTPAGDWHAGDRGFAAVPGRGDAFETGLAQALNYAKVLKPQYIHILSGIAAGPSARACFVDNLRKATTHAPNQNFLIEPINPVDMPGYFLNDYTLAREIIAEINAPNLGLQFDAYHAQRITGDALAAWPENRPITRHIQVAGTPGRHEPIPSDIDYAAFFRQLDRDGYAGFISGEYNPVATTQEGLGWINGDV